jgi:pyruvate-formate lyase
MPEAAQILHYFDPRVTIPDLSLKDISLEKLPLLKRLRDDYTNVKQEFCLELPSGMTYYLRELDNKSDGPELRAGRLNEYILRTKRPVIPDDSLLAGTTTAKRRGVMVHPESLTPLTVWPELETISQRDKRPFHLTPEQMEVLDQQIFPYWMDKTVLERTRKECGESDSLKLMQRLLFFINSKAAFIGHTIPNFKEVLGIGLNGIIAKAAEQEKNTGDEDKKEFYQAVQLSLKGVLVYADKLSRYAAEVAEALARVGEEEPEALLDRLTKKYPETGFLQDRWKLSTEEQKRLTPEQQVEQKWEIIKEFQDNVTKMKEICAWVPAKPARTFREAVNAIWLCYVGLHQESFNATISPGRLDQVLYPVFRQDLEEAQVQGRTDEFLREAVELVGCLWLKLGDHIPAIPVSVDYVMGGSGCNQAVTLGGVDRQGRCAVNDLTYVMLKATELLQLRDPNVNARYFPGKNSKEYLQRLCEVNITTGATPCYHNDQAVVETLRALNVKEEDALDYGAVGCVEPVSSGRTFGNTGGVWMNLPAALELALFQGKHRLIGLGPDGKQIGIETPAPQGMESYEEFQEAFKTQLTCLIEQAVTVNNNLGIIYQKYNPFPLMSALTEGCLENGKDVLQGGATYNSTGMAMIGLAEVVDSLTAIEKLVFLEKTVSFAELLEAISRNWHGYEKLRLRALGVKSPNDPGKFGTSSLLAKKNADWLMKFLGNTCREQKNYRGGRFTAGYWTMTTHAGFGALTRALPSGRKDWESLPSGITPVSSVPTEDAEVYCFIAGLDHKQIGNGQALNIKYPPPAKANRKYLSSYKQKFADVIEAYFRMGGLQVQFNLIDRAKLMEAREALKINPQHPEYQDILVRVSGYTAFFHDLDLRMQDEIISRTQYDLNTGEAEPYVGASLAGPQQRGMMLTIVLKLGLTKTILKLGLRVMQFLLWLKQDFKDCIANFKGSYVLFTTSGSTMVPVVFNDGAMHLPGGPVDMQKADATLELRDEAALLDYLYQYATGKNQDLLAGVVRNEITPHGNLNYIFKFAFIINKMLFWVHNLLPWRRS